MNKAMPYSGNSTPVNIRMRSCEIAGDVVRRLSQHNEIVEERVMLVAVCFNRIPSRTLGQLDNAINETEHVLQSRFVAIFVCAHILIASGQTRAAKRGSLNKAVF